MAYGYFNSLMSTLDRMGVTDIILPFFLIFVLVFSTLEKTRILGVMKRKDGQGDKPKTNLNVMLSLVLGLGVVIPHATNSYPPGRDVVTLLNTAMPGIMMVLVAIFSFLLLIGMFIGKQPEFMKSSTLSTTIIIVAAAAVGIIFVDSANIYRMPRWLYFLQDPSTQAAIIVIIVFGALVWFITREDDNPGNNDNDFGKQMRKVFGNSD